MDISGLQKLTLLDYPGRTACTVFLAGCNFRCPFCHNSEILTADVEPETNDEELLAFLKKRVGLLDGVAVTGGEPTQNPGLPELLRKIRELGYPVKLDTNGSRPALLRKLAEEGLVNYVAMDVKNDPVRYARTAGLEKLDMGPIRESLQFLLTGDVDYELRTTVVAELHDADSFRGIGDFLRELSPEKKAKRFFLQPFVDRDSVMFAGFHAPAKEAMEQYRQILSPFVEQCSVRGQD